MVKLTRIYTRTGDDGTTGLGNFSRVPKTDSRIAAVADVNEANAAIGVAVALLEPDRCDVAAHDVKAIAVVLQRIQNDLFDVGADLCLPLAQKYDTPPLRVDASWIDELESECDRFNADLASLRSFILPGGSLVAAQLHAACTIVRRSERSVWAAIEIYGTATEGINLLAVQYLNRLSDLLFILARCANGSQGDVEWVPSGGRKTK